MARSIDLKSINLVLDFDFYSKLIYTAVCLFEYVYHLHFYYTSYNTA